jgi:hypothetical protein
VAFVVDGEVKCIGSPEFLAERYCQGYFIVAQIIPEDFSFYQQVCNWRWNLKINVLVFVGVLSYRI